jgi:thiol:disulfide interchange protein
MVNAVKPAIWMMLAVAACLAAPIWGCPQSAAAQTIEWHDYEEGMNLSSARNRSVLIDFATSWCSWCKKMDADTYGDARVIEKALRFVCIRVDGDNRSDLVSIYGVDGYPTTVFLDPNGTVAHNVVGYKGPDDFLPDMDYALGEAEKPAQKSGSGCILGLVPMMAVPAILIASRRPNGRQPS